eukprot:jgi/Mesvir1/11008/Mv21517-RA.1
MELAVEFENNEMPEEAVALRAKAQKVESQLQRMRTQFQKRWGDPRPDAPAGSERAKKRDLDEIRVLNSKLAKNATDIANAQREKQGRRVALLNLAREMIEKELGEKSAAYRVRYNQSPTSSQGPAVPPRADGPVTRSASAAARSEDIGGGAYSGGLDRDDGGGGEAASGKSIPNLEEDVERLRGRVEERDQSIQEALDKHLAQPRLDQRKIGRDRAMAELALKIKELEAARARSKGKGLAVPEKVSAPPGPSRLSPYPDEEEEDVLQALTSLSARAPDKSSSSGQTTSAGGPKAGGTRAGVSPLDMKVADTLVRMAADPSSARRSAMSDAVSDAGGSGARLEGSGKRPSKGGDEEGTGDSTAESGPRTEQSWTEYLTELRGAMNKAVDMTEQAKGNRTYMTEAKRAVQALRTKASSAPPLHPNFRAKPVSDSVEKSSVLADACDYVLNLLGSALLNVVEIAKASQAMRILCREADKMVTRELQLVSEPVTLMPTPPRPDTLPAPSTSTWLTYFRELRELQKDAVEATKKTIKDRNFVERAHDILEDLDKKVDAVPSGYQNMEYMRTHNLPGGYSADKSQNLVVACDGVLDKVDNTPDDRDAIEEARESMMVAYNEAVEAVEKEVGIVNEGAGILPGVSQGVQTRSSSRTAAASPAPPSPAGGGKTPPRAPPAPSPAGGGSTPRPPASPAPLAGGGNTPPRPTPPTGGGNTPSPGVRRSARQAAARGKEQVEGSPATRTTPSSEREEGEVARSLDLNTAVARAMAGNARGGPSGLGVNEYGSNVLDGDNPVVDDTERRGEDSDNLHAVVSMPPARLLPLDAPRIYNPKYSDRVDRPFTMKIPNTENDRILYRRSALEGADSFYNAIFVIKAFRAKQQMEASGLRPRVEELKRKLGQQLGGYLKIAQSELGFDPGKKTDIISRLAIPTSKGASAEVIAITARYLKNDIVVVSKRPESHRLPPSETTFADVRTYRAFRGKRTGDPYCVYFDGNRFEALLTTFELPSERHPVHQAASRSMPMSAQSHHVLAQRAYALQRFADALSAPARPRTAPPHPVAQNAIPRYPCRRRDPPTSRPVPRSRRPPRSARPRPSTRSRSTERRRQVSVAARPGASRLRRERPCSLPAFFSELVVRTMKCKRKTVTHGGRCKNEARPGRKTCAIHARGVHHVARSCGMHVARTKETKRKYDDMATGIPSAPATVADAVRLSWLSRFPGQTGAPTQEEAKKGK